MRNANGMGGVSKLSGKRRRPYWARVTTGWEINEKTGKTKQLTATIGYFATRKEAMIALANYHQNPIDLAKKDITFAEVWDLWSPDYFKRTPSSKNGLNASYKKCERLYNMSMKDIRKVHLQAVLDGMSDMSEQSQKKVKTVFKMTYKYCLENDIVTKDYSQFVTTTSTQTPTVKDKFFTTEELEKVFANPNDSVLMLLYTGMRVGELLEVKCEDIDLEKRIIHVRGTKTENADRFVPIHINLLPIIERNMGNEYLIGMSYNTYTRKVFNPYLESLGISHTPHATRHTFISMMDKCGANKVALKRIVGHSNTSMTEHYTHKGVEDLIETIDQLTYLRH